MTYTSASAGEDGALAAAVAAQIFGAWANRRASSKRDAAKRFYLSRSRFRPLVELAIEWLALRNVGAPRGCNRFRPCASTVSPKCRNA